MGKKLYVGNLPFSVNDQTLNDAFAQCGTVVSAKVISDKFSGRSKGFGFVEMSTDEEAQAAIAKFNEQDFSGRNLTVNEAREERPFGDRPRRDFGGEGRGGERRGGFGGGERRGGFGGGRGGRSSY